jgi:parvulin-like peptidyl-prolyl isomerase
MATIEGVRRLVLLGLLAVLVAACGGSNGKIAAHVAGDPIPASRIDVLMDSARVTYRKNGRPFPKVGSDGYLSLRDRALGYLIVAKELEQRAAKELGVHVTDAEIDAATKKAADRQFGGSMDKLNASIKAQGLTRAEYDEEERLALTQVAVTKKIASGATISQKDVEAYYKSHLKDFTRPRNRLVREIRVDKVELANSLYKRLKSGADFATLAKKYSKDPEVKTTGGKFTAAEGVGNAFLVKTALALRTGQIAPPFVTVHGWHIVQALSPVKPAKVFKLSQVAGTIRSTLGQQAKGNKVSNWVVETKRTYCLKNEVTYEKGFKPFDDPCLNVQTPTG